MGQQCIAPEYADPLLTVTIGNLVFPIDDDSAVDPSMFVDVESVFLNIKPAYDMVEALRRLPRKDSEYASVLNSSLKNHEFAPDTWTRGVLPLIGDVKNYKEKILAASKAFISFGRKYRILETNSVKASLDVMQNIPPPQYTWSVIKLWGLPDGLKEAIASVTDMMSSITDWQKEFLDEENRIKCIDESKGVPCPSNSRSAAFSTGLGTELCYRSEERGDNICYSRTYNPHITGYKNRFFMSVTDPRSGKNVSGLSFEKNISEYLKLLNAQPRR